MLDICFLPKLLTAINSFSIKSSTSKHRTAASPRSPSLPLPLNIQLSRFCDTFRLEILKLICWGFFHSVSSQYLILYCRVQFVSIWEMQLLLRASAVPCVCFCLSNMRTVLAVLCVTQLNSLHSQALLLSHYKCTRQLSVLYSHG